MKKNHSATWLRVAVVTIALLLAAFDFYFIPFWGWEISRTPGFEVYFWPWLAFTWAASLPVYAALIALWKLAKIFNSQSPVGENGARILLRICRYALGDAVFLFVTNIVLASLHLSQPGVVLLLLCVAVLCFAVAAGAKAFSQAFSRMGTEITSE